MPRAKKPNEIGRVIAIGHSLYMHLPTGICEHAGLKKGDRIAMDTDGRMIYATRVPMEELLPRRKPPLPAALAELIG